MLPLRDLRVVIVSFVMVYSFFCGKNIDINDEKSLSNSLKVIA